MQDVLRNWFDNEDHRVTPITIGLLNQTFLVENRRGQFVLQKLNPVFSPQVNLDIEALTSHIQNKGLSTPRLVRRGSGELWCVLEGSCWRLLTFIEGESHNVLRSADYARQAGQLVGEFHRALVDFRHDYRFSRPNAHDTKAHLNKLEGALLVHQDHEKIFEVAALAEQILSEAQTLGDLSGLPKRHSHGDLKINNLLFGRSGTNSLIDLDTIGLLPWPIEMADAFRSWCNPHGEDTESVIFDEVLFEAALSAYAKEVSDLWTIDEVQNLLEAVRTIPLELASRFLRDVLEDTYFGYDPKRFVNRAAHNWVRAKGQLGVYCAIEKKKAQLEHIIRRAFA